MDSTNRKQRLAARREGQLDTAAFLKVADKFIDLANRKLAAINAAYEAIARERGL